MSSQSDKASTGPTLVNTVLTIAAVVIVTLMLVAVPAVLALSFVLVARRRVDPLRLPRRSTLLVLAGLSLASSWALSADFGTYLRWQFARVGLGSTALSDFPTLFVAALVTFFAATMLVLLDSRLVAWFPKFLQRMRPTVRRSLVPTQKQQQMLRSVSLPEGVALTVGKAAASGEVLDEATVIPLGLNGNRKPVTVTLAELGTHMLIMGSTGSGKTETLKALAGALFDLGMDGMVIDHKEDTKKGGLRDFLFEYSQHHGRPYQELCLSDSQSQTWFNALSGIGPDEARDALLANMSFDDAFWANLNKDMLGQLIRLLYLAHQAEPSKFAYPDPFLVGTMLKNGQKINEATRAMRAVVKLKFPGYSDQDFIALSNPTQDEGKSAVGFGSKLTNVYRTEAGKNILQPGDGNARAELDVTAPGVAYVGLDNMGKTDLTSMVSAAILKRMSVYAADRTTGKVASNRKRFIIIDEASVVNRTIVKDLLARCRSAGVIIILATQGPTDWINELGDDFSNMVNNINIILVMTQGDPRSAEMLAEVLGKDEFDTVNVGFQGGMKQQRGTVVRREDYVVRPDEIRRLEVGQGVLRVNNPKTRLEWLQVIRRKATDGPATNSPFRAARWARRAARHTGAPRNAEVAPGAPAPEATDSGQERAPFSGPNPGYAYGGPGLIGPVVDTDSSYAGTTDSGPAFGSFPDAHRSGYRPQATTSGAGDLQQQEPPPPAARRIGPRRL